MKVKKNILSNIINLTIPKIIGYFSAPIIILFFFLPSQLTFIEIEIWKSIGIIILMVLFWITEVIPIYVTALLPLVLIPLLELMPLKNVSINYSHPIIFLFFGGFIIAKAIEKYNLHERISYKILSFFPFRFIGLGIFITAAILSMWISNTATALMLIPIIQTVINILESEKNLNSVKKEIDKFEILLLLLTAYGCNIGGMATIIGTPPNTLYVGFIKEKYNINISFIQWALIGIPVIIFILFIIYIIIEKYIFKINIPKISLNRIHFDQNKPWKTEEKLVLIVFLITIFLWLLQPLISKILPYFNDSLIAMLMAIVLFFIPTDIFKGKFLMEWKDIQEMKQIWGILILFGGGLALAKLIQEKGVSKYIAKHSLWFKNMQSSIPDFILLFLIIYTISFFIIFFTEITSNTATTATFLPIISAIVEQNFQNSYILLLTIPLSASCAFMLPIATPPNAIIFSTEKITIKQMAKTGFLLNIIFSFLITLFIMVLYYLIK
ncbi:MAG: SLC13 family permease [Leptospiraceae bacterium]|nr:MAG: SLC13 family permease [Leptospiraceae bacterium]